jgi:ABC-2 type transport system ATP-binding protein
VPVAIHTDALTKRFATRSGAFTAVDGLDRTVDAGERIAFIGPNGAGKSTSIKLLTGMLTPSSGTATVLGLVPWQKRRHLAHGIGTIFGQRSQLLADLPARATFDLLARIYALDLAAYRRERDDLCEVLDANDVIDQPVRTLSLGQRMRCELVASMLHRPQLVFLDEPTIGLDLLAKRTLRELVVPLNLERGTTFLLTSHDVADIETVAERVVIIDHGRSVFDGGVDTLRTSFLRTKLVDVAFADASAPPAAVAGCELLDASPTSLRLSIDLGQRGIGSVLDELIAHRTVVDISITEPPLESVIGHIYEASGADRA